MTRSRPQLLLLHLSLTAVATVAVAVAARARQLASFDASSDLPHGEMEVRRHLETWLKHVELNGLERTCDGLFGPPGESAALNRSLVLVAPATEEEEKSSCPEYTFTGKLSGGLPEGKGTLRFRRTKVDKSKREKRCLRRGRIFGSDVEQVKGAFAAGVPRGKAALRWSNGIRAEVFLSDGGIPHGVFKVEAASAKQEEEEEEKKKKVVVWTVGNLVEGVVRDECWVATDEQIRYGNCTDAFVFSEDLPTVVMHRSHLAYRREGGADGRDDGDSVRPTRASMAVVGLMRGDTLKEAHDCELTALAGDTKCARQLTHGRFRPSFVYDLKSGERRFKLFRPEEEKLCREDAAPAEGREESGEAIRRYFAGLSLEKATGFPLDTTKIEHGEARKLLTGIEHLGGNRYEAMLNFFSPGPVEFRHQGDLDPEGRFSGYTVLRVSPREYCYRGRCSWPAFMRVAGHFVDGELQGPVTLVSRGERRQSVGLMVSDGIVHGLVVGEGLPLHYPAVAAKGKEKSGGAYAFNSRGVGLVARFANGRPVGKVWLGMVGDAQASQPGFLYGEPRIGPGDTLNMTGDAIAYLYPWYESALVGRFEDNYMREARYAHVSSARCDHNLLEVDFQVVAEEEDRTYSYDPATAETIASDLTLRDPYEAENVVVRESSIPGAGDGVYALRRLRRGQLVALYTGLAFGDGDAAAYQSLCDRIKDSRSPCDRYSISTHTGATLIVPPPFDDWSVNSATAAWKTNNGFNPDAHTYFHDVEHPRFGLIPAITAMREVEAGEELLIDYGYSDLHENFTDSNHYWYYQAKKEHYAKLEMEKQEKEEEGSKEEEKGEEAMETEKDDGTKDSSQKSEL